MGFEFENRVAQLLSEILLELKGYNHNRWLTIDDVVKYVPVSSSTIRRAIKQGKLNHSNSSGRLLFRTSDLDNWLLNK